jgi:protein ImuB
MTRSVSSVPGPATVRPPCWIALHFPHLSLDRVTRGLEHCRETAIVISDAGSQRPLVLDCNPAAQRFGITAGMPVSSALALNDAVGVVQRDPQREQRCLRRIAAWGYQYSSEISVCTDSDTLMLEAAASERLFGCPEQLATRLVRELCRIGYHALAGSAPTPAAARIAAGSNLHIASVGAIREQLSPLPLERLETGPESHQALRRMGFRTIREVLRLPRKALARRLGPGLVNSLDRLLGHKPDPLRRYQPPDGFNTGMDLPSEITHSQALLFPLRRLVAELCGTLRAQDKGIQQLTVRLRHEGRAESGIHIGLQQSTRDEARLMLLLRERLERLRLPQAVHHVQMEASRLLSFEAQQEDLFHDCPETAAQPVAPLLERLQARLGRDAVTGLRGVEDHRPEYSWSTRKPGEPAACAAMPHRPVWLLPQPRKCRIEEYRILAGPERIESGWWDGDDCRRDYFVVRDIHGSTLWAFHEYKPRTGWYLHGLFS